MDSDPQSAWALTSRGNTFTDEEFEDVRNAFFEAFPYLNPKEQS